MSCTGRGGRKLVLASLLTMAARGSAANGTQSSLCHTAAAPAENYWFSASAALHEQSNDFGFFALNFLTSALQWSPACSARSSSFVLSGTFLNALFTFSLSLGASLSPSHLPPPEHQNNFIASSFSFTDGVFFSQRQEREEGREARGITFSGRTCFWFFVLRSLLSPTQPWPLHFFALHLTHNSFCTGFAHSRCYSTQVCRVEFCLHLRHFAFSFFISR